MSLLKEFLSLGYPKLEFSKEIKEKCKNKENLEFTERFINSKVFRLAYKQLQKENPELLNISLVDFLNSSFIKFYWSALIDNMIKVRDFILLCRANVKKIKRRWRK